ncbi:unnamed protein product [Calicophoron daubneyi]|uniref:acid phosphatase n=1 Tax=Calicophoron daubneyi TaxID=300641 RepID=A0AAV2TQD5_CALDB
MAQIRSLWMLALLFPNLITLAFTVSLLDPDGTQIFVFTISRHGDRSPVHELPDDPCRDFWANGYGQLTKLGAEQHAALGEFFRHSYPGFFPSKYHKDDVLFRSSGMERTIMSANSFIRGFYKHQLAERDYIPPPVYSIPVINDHLLKMSGNCPEYTKRLDNLMASKVTVDAVRHYSATIDLLRKNIPSAFPPDPNPSQLLRSAWAICDTVVIWVNRNVPGRPPWATDKLSNQCMEVLSDKQYSRFALRSVTRLRGGPLAAHLLRLLRVRANVELGQKKSDEGFQSSLLPLVLPDDWSEEMTKRRRLVAYFAHDSTMAALMNHLDIHNHLLPPLASCLMVELHHVPEPRLPDDEFFVRFRYRNVTDYLDSRTYTLWPPACGSQNIAFKSNYLCSLTRLENSLIGTYASDVKSECLGRWSSFKLLNETEGCHYQELMLLVLVQFVVMLYLLGRLNGRPFSLWSSVNLLR